MALAGPPPPGGDWNRASEVHAFTWSLQIVALILVAGRMYSRAKLTRNTWWDDWVICISVIVGIAISITHSVYAGSGYARHQYYLTPPQVIEALKLKLIARSMSVISTILAKISVALLIERIAPPGNWRKWLLRGISLSLVVTAIVSVALYYAECHPARALWDKEMIENGTGECWDPVPVMKFYVVCGSYWAFLDLALAIIPVDIVWRLQISKKKRFSMCILLSMGVIAGICAAVKTSKISHVVTAGEDVSWSTVELLMWRGIEMNVIVIAACIPTLRPLFLVIFRHPHASAYRDHDSNSNPKVRHTSYHKTPDSDNTNSSRFSLANNRIFGTGGGGWKAGDGNGSPNGSTKGIFSKGGIVVNKDITIESQELAERGEGERWERPIGEGGGKDGIGR